MTIYRITGDDGPDDVTLMMLDDRLRLVNHVFVGGDVSEADAVKNLSVCRPLGGYWQNAPSECYHTDPLEAACRLMRYLATEGGASVVTDVEEIR